MAFHDRNLKAQAEQSTDAAILAHAGRAVRAFLVHLKDNPAGDRLHDVGALPHSKETLINAFRLLIANERRLEQREQLQAVGLSLAQFRAAVDAPSTDDADPLASWIDTVDVEPAAMADDRQWQQVYLEQERLAALFKLSARVAERRDVPGVTFAVDGGTPLAAPSASI